MLRDGKEGLPKNVTPPRKNNSTSDNGKKSRLGAEKVITLEQQSIEG